MISALAFSSFFILCPIFRIYSMEISISFITLSTLCSVLAIYSFCRSITSCVCAIVATTRSEFIRRVFTISSMLPLAASILAFNDNKLVSSAISEINWDASRMLCAELLVCVVCSAISDTARFTSSLILRISSMVTAVLSLAPFMLSALLSSESASFPV